MGTAGSGSYAHEIADAVGTAVLEAVWVASRDLSRWRRWLLRLGVTGAVAAAGAVARPGDGPERGDPPAGTAPASGPGTEGGPRLDPRVVGAGVTLAAGAAVAQHVVTRRWAERLRRSGHAHPYTAVGVRTALVLLAVRLPERLVGVHRRRSAGGREDGGTASA